MHIDPNNPVVILCAKGMELEGYQPEEAERLFMQAWNSSSDDDERSISAHYVARCQKTNAEKLIWNKTALKAALSAGTKASAQALPSLYLNVAKCYEDMNETKAALEHYGLALSLCNFPENDGYGKWTENAIRKGLERIAQSEK